MLYGGRSTGFGGLKAGGGALGPGSKLVIALCRKPFDDVDDELAFGSASDSKKEEDDEEEQMKKNTN
jgi:hypothetical protein